MPTTALALIPTLAPTPSAGLRLGPDELCPGCGRRGTIIYIASIDALLCIGDQCGWRFDAPYTEADREGEPRHPDTRAATIGDTP